MKSILCGLSTDIFLKVFVFKSSRECNNGNPQGLAASVYDNFSFSLKTRYCPLCIARCDFLAAIFVMLKILRLLFVARIELFNNNGRLAPMKTKTTKEARKA